MLLSEIQAAVFGRIDADSSLVPCIHEGKTVGSYQTGNVPYAVASIVPLDNREPTYCDSVMRSGFIFVKVYAPRGHGAWAATVEAERFVALFPEGLELGALSVPDTGDIKGVLNSEIDGWFYVPITIYFEAR